MTMTTQARAVLFSAFIAVPMQASADFEPIAGKWEQSFTSYMFVHSANKYAPWEHPMGSSCYSDAALKKLWFLSAAGSKHRQEEDGRSCEASEEKAAGSSASWRMRCSNRDGAMEDIRTTLSMSSTEIRSSSVLRVAGKEDSFGPDGMRTELVMRRVGDCEEKGGTNK